MIPHRVKLSDVVEKAHPQAVVLSTHSSDGEAAKMFPFKRTSLSFFSTKQKNVSFVKMFPFQQKYFGSHLQDEWDAE